MHAGLLLAQGVYACCHGNQNFWVFGAEQFCELWDRLHRQFTVILKTRCILAFNFFAMFSVVDGVLPVKSLSYFFLKFSMIITEAVFPTDNQDRLPLRNKVVRS